MWKAVELEMQEKRHSLLMQTLVMASLERENSALRAKVANLESTLSQLQEEKAVSFGIATGQAAALRVLSEVLSGMEAELLKQKAAGVSLAGKRLEKLQLFQANLLNCSLRNMDLRILSGSEPALRGAVMKRASSSLSGTTTASQLARCYVVLRELNRRP